MTVDVASVATRLQTAGATLSSLGAQLQSAAPDGTFDQVLKAASQAIENALDPQTATASSATTGLVGATGGTGLSGLSGLGANVSGSDVVADAVQYLGVPYQWGGTNPATGLDCSGLVQRVYGDLGISLPRTSQEQATVGTAVSSLSQAQPGDLVFYEPSAGGPQHVGIYVGNGQMIDAPHTGTTVQVQPVGTPSEIRRVLPGSDSGALAALTDFNSLSGVGSLAGTSSTGLSVPPSLAPLFEAASAQYGVPANLLAAVAQTESNFNPQAVSGAGAQGIMQLMPGTAAGLGVDPFDPAQAIGGAAKMLSGLVTQFGSVPLALAAYNAGPGAVQQYGGIPPYAETQAYVQKVMGLAGGVTA